MIKIELIRLEYVFICLFRQNNKCKLVGHALRTTTTHNY
jgi:hypothetical protein